MKQFQATIKFRMTDEFMDLIPPHRTYINHLIQKGIIDNYAVSMETHRVWITMNADSKDHVKALLAKSPLHKYWTVEVDELFILDGHQYRLPELQMN